MQSPSQILNLRPLSERFPEELGDFQRFFEIFEAKFSDATPQKGCDPLIRGRNSLNYQGGRIADPFHKWVVVGRSVVRK